MSWDAGQVPEVVPVDVPRQDPEPAHRPPGWRLPPATRASAGRNRDGQVLRVDGDRLIVLFDDVGYKTLSVQLAAENDLLEVVAG